MTKTFTLRANWGSYPEVIRVFSFDEVASTALVKFRYREGNTAIDRVSLDELEALDDERRFVDTVAAVREMDDWN